MAPINHSLPSERASPIHVLAVLHGVLPQLDLYYNGFCNSVLWQLFHYVPLNIDSFQKMSEHRAMQMQWQAYQVCNAYGAPLANVSGGLSTK